MSEIKIVDDLLEERRELLMEEVSRRIEKSKKVCDLFFSNLTDNYLG